MPTDATKPPPDALLLIAPDCPHCPTVLQGLADLVKQGAIGSLEVVNIAARPERAAALGVRSVPWFRIGQFRFQGLHSPAELASWAEQTGTAAGTSAYIDAQLSSGQLQTVETVVREDPALLHAIVALAADVNTATATRIGIAALLEGLRGSGLGAAIVPALAEALPHDNPRVRADIVHYLALTESAEAKPYLKAALDDTDAEVREIAADGLAELMSHSNA